MANRKESVLLYLPRNGKKNQLIKVALIRLGVKVKLVTQEQFALTIGDLLGVEEFSEKEKFLAHEEVDNHVTEESELIATLDQEMIVMDQFTSAKIDALIRELRKAGIPKVNLKAVVTQENIHWTFQKLATELIKEDAFYRKLD